MTIEKLYVNVYHVTRRYGGPEEGGWYYDNYECVEVVPARSGRAKELQEQLEQEYKDQAYGNISSVLGGQEVHVLIEKTRAQSETREVPIYE